MEISSYRGDSSTLYVTILVLKTMDLASEEVITDQALLHSNLPGLTLLFKGKVRDVYTTSIPDHLLFVASDRISAYDVILKNVSLLSQ